MEEEARVAEQKNKKRSHTKVSVSKNEEQKRKEMHKKDTAIVAPFCRYFCAFEARVAIFFECFFYFYLSMG